MTSPFSRLPVDKTDTSAPWPKFSASDRRKLFDLCGSECFALEPSKHSKTPRGNARHLYRFPLCRPVTDKASKKECKLSPVGLLAARRRSLLTKAYVGDKYKSVAQALTKFIEGHHITAKSKKEWPISKVTVFHKPHLAVKIHYENGEVDNRKHKPLLARTILAKYGKYLSPKQRHRLVA